MKSIVNRLLLPTLIIVTLIAIFSLSGCSGYGSSSPNSSISGSANSVNMANLAFSPATLTIKVGTTVTWTNKDSTTHTVISDSGVFQSGNMAPNATFTYTFSNAGTFPYHCSIHPSMKGTVVVQ
ncbi:MAG: hypothetical protein A2Z74_00750 [Chloroflexi bacterium RBG_13_46_9]|nr:MAG: hypothetical protein A2Z74_00750 [Chloroflexi bacterium RBG_13_46_9]